MLDKLIFSALMLCIFALVALYMIFTPMFMRYIGLVCMSCALLFLVGYDDTHRGGYA